MLDLQIYMYEDWGIWKLFLKNCSIFHFSKTYMLCWSTVNSLIEDRLVFNFWTFKTVLYSSFYYIKVPVLTVFWVFYSKKSFIQMSLLLASLRYKIANLASFKYDFSLKSGFVRKWISDAKGNPHKKMFEIAHCRDFPPRMEESSCSAQSQKDCVRIPFIIRYFKKSLSFK